MRYDTPIYFQRVTSGAYIAETGDYEADKVTETLCYASVTDSGEDIMRLIYGELKQDSLIVRLQNHYTAPFDRVRIGDKLYHVDFARKLRTKHSFIVSEVQ